MKSFTVRVGDTEARCKFARRDDGGWDVGLIRNGGMVATGIPEPVEGPALKFTLPDDTALVAYPQGERAVRRGNHLDDETGERLVDTPTIHVSPGVFAVEGLPALFGARITESRAFRNVTNATIVGLEFVDEQAVERRWTGELIAAPRNCGSCGGGRRR